MDSVFVSALVSVFVSLFDSAFFDSESDVAVAVEYLRTNFTTAGSTLAFTTASLTALGYTGVRTFVFTKGSSAANDLLVSLFGVTATSHNNGAGKNKGLYFIDTEAVKEETIYDDQNYNIMSVTFDISYSGLYTHTINFKPPLTIKAPVLLEVVGVVF